MNKLLSLVVLVGVLANPAIAQPEAPVGSQFRSAAGAPGAGYWQQRVDYKISAELIPKSQTVTANATIRYTNNSPDTLHFVWLHLEQNVFKRDSIGSVYHPLKGDEVKTFSEAGFDIKRIAVIADGVSVVPQQFVSGTRMRLDLEKPLSGGGSSIDIEIAWTFVVPKDGLGRMGREEHAAGWVYSLAQWYPRLAVYDDLHGWNPAPYTPWRNFYLEYGDFDVTITAPSGMTVMGTGQLQNPEEVLSAEQRGRLNKAKSLSEPIFIIRPDEVVSSYDAEADSDTKIWNFKASNVRDFVWAASAGFIWDAVGLENALIMSLYPKEGLGTLEQPGWETVTEYSRKVLAFLSDRFGAYPYPVLLNVASADGQEYPMVHFSPASHRGDKLYSLVGHEIAHMWFPMQVGFDEQRYPWIDEGIAAFMDYYLQLEIFDRLMANREEMGDAERFAETMQKPFAQQSIAIPAESIGGPNIGLSKSFLHYRKPGYGFVLLRESIIGREQFDYAFRLFVREWSNKHPRPVDLFRVLENVSGKDLGWFWQGWYNNDILVDQSVDAVVVEPAGTRVMLSSNEELHMPVELEITFSDDRRVTVLLPVLFWSSSNQNSYLIADTGDVQRLVIDPGRLLPDINRDNNLWVAEEIH